MVSIPKISPNLLLGILGIGGAVLLVNQLRKAGGDLQQALKDGILPEFPALPSIPSIDIKFPEISQPDKDILERIEKLEGGLGALPQEEVIDILSDLTPLGTPENPATSPTAPTAIDIILNDSTLTQKQKDELIAKINPITPETAPQLFDPNLFQPPTESTPPFQGPVPPLREERPLRIEDLLPDTRPVAPVLPPPIIESLLPDDQVFKGGGESFIGGTIRENPIDTLSEVIKFFPELSASQAADFLAETGGKILPSEVDKIDPDIKNIVANISGENIQVDAFTSPSALKEQELKAAEFTCKNFGLNCELLDGGMA